MSNVTRRDFIKSSVAAGVGLALAAPHSRVLGANDQIRVAVVGVGGQGGGHMGYFHGCEGAKLVAICDADTNQMDGKAKAFEEKQGYKLRTYTDVRKLLEDKDIDVITSATPNHWHALVTIWACQAGKDVYIEKPASYCIWEGRKMVEAARKYNRIVQIGMQKRSSEAHPAAFEWIKEGHIGKIKWVRGFCYKGRGPGTNGIVHGTNGPKPIPASVDYNQWCGPADMVPLNRTDLHYVWHWMWNTGNGDIGNQGPHEMDIARWALGDPGLPQHVFSIGGRFGMGETDDVGETANTQIAYFDYKPAPLIFEVRGLPRKKGDRAMDHYRGTRVGDCIQCEGGCFPCDDGGGWVLDNDGKRIKQFSGRGGAGHHENFIKAVRSRKVSDLNGDIEIGHLSAALCHMANTSHRLGKKATVDEVFQAIGDNEEMFDSFSRMVEHLVANEVDLEKERITLGPVLTMDADKERYVGEHSDMANMYLKRNYREPFIVPENV
ncbi:MAG: Gfo/Idh/MocA family oxidoreductase [Sedimentisphaerales bacterium]|jgi:predicted dehydrogenase|nr:Gfo/Idh/MocA family oxidoreductase [Sedimentisphaerales bacterium]HNY78132.1 Gfo/Idh/MocA family oxidoreductase [Sedimentisphaerales bacterium]HOC65066.1 Gfo/Idh/MocA family oxidoreductase [Sedimentisphaerales bacterium]HOH63170.1 Gfo/Idh/MocA family oxidoreductase [Sedimentisphaerales bacterium]HPY50991.1 Gfo/Idh/MocA family oxidoreductase [Sedimentisphaerales bacterium]